MFKVQGSLLFVTYTIIQGIISSEMLEASNKLQIMLIISLASINLIISN